MHAVIELREPGADTRQIDVSFPAVFGREGVDVVLSDPTISRRHAVLDRTPTGLVLVDLNSSNGTWVNGLKLSPDSQTSVDVGCELRMGDTVLRVVNVEVTGTMRVSPPQPLEQAQKPVVRRPTRLEQRPVDGDVIHYRRGSAGERALDDFAAAYARARKRLAGFGSESWRTRIDIHLADPFPDPEGTGILLTEGTVISETANELWFIVTPEVAPEPPERPLAVLFGSVLPAASAIAHLVEGYGLHLAKTPDPDVSLREQELPAFETASGALRSAMALSFVRFLVKRHGAESVRRFISVAPPHQLDRAAQDEFGSALSSLEEEWRDSLEYGEEKVKPRQFLRLSMRYLRPHLVKQVELGIYMLLSLAFTVSFPFITRRLFDTALPSGKFAEVAKLLALLGLAFGISLAAGLRQAYVAAFVGGAIVRSIRAEMFDKLQYLSIGWFDRRHQGDILSRMFNDVAILERGISQTLRQGIFQMVSLVISAVVVLRLNLLLGLIVLAAAPVVGVVYRLMRNGAQRRSLAVQERNSNLYSIAAENYSAQEVVKAFGLQPHERQRFGAALDRHFAAERRLSVFGGVFGLSVNLIVTMLRLSILGLGAWLVLNGRITVGTLVAFMGVMGEVISPVTGLTTLGQEIQTASGALVRVNEVLAETSEVDELPNAEDCPVLNGSIVFRNVSFRYTPDAPTLVDIDLMIPQGSRVAVVGPSGAGKSSVLQLLLRNYDPDRGAVVFDDRDLRTVTIDSLRDQIGVVFQDSFLFDASIRENIALGRLGATAADVEAAARAADVHDFIAALPRGYDTSVGERGGRLSGGQRQRIAIARALVRNPSILVLDEATSALDPSTERRINDTLARVGRGRTTIAVTHRLASVVNYDRIFVLDGGHLVEQGSHHELLALNGVYASMWREQAGGDRGAPDASVLVEALREVPLFAGLSAVDLATAAESVATFELSAQQRLGDWKGLYVLVRGRGRVHQPTPQGPATVTALEAGQCFGLAAALGSPSASEFEALEPVVLGLLDVAALGSLAARYPSVAAQMNGSAAPTPREGKVLPRLTIAQTASAIDGAAAAPRPDSLVSLARRSGIMRPVQ